MRGRKRKDAAVELGLSILLNRIRWLMDSEEYCHLVPIFRIFEAAACYCGVSREAMRLQERSALRKMRFRLEQKGVSWEEAKYALQHWPVNGARYTEW